MVTTELLFMKMPFYRGHFEPEMEDNLKNDGTLEDK